MPTAGFEPARISSVGLKSTALTELGQIGFTYIIHISLNK